MTDLKPIETDSAKLHEETANDETDGIHFLLTTLSAYELLHPDCLWLDQDSPGSIRSFTPSAVSTESLEIPDVDLESLNSRQRRTVKYRRFVSHFSRAAKGNPVPRIPTVFDAYTPQESWENYLKSFRGPLLENTRSDLAQKAGLLTNKLCRFYKFDVVRWGEDSERGNPEGGVTDSRKGAKHNRKKKAAHKAFDEDIMEYWEGPEEVKASDYWEEDVEEEFSADQEKEDASVVMIKVSREELRSGDVVLFSEVDLPKSEDMARFLESPEKCQNDPIFSKIGFLHVYKVSESYIDKKKNRTYDAVAKCTVYQFSPSSPEALPTFIYISEVLTSSTPLNRVFRSLSNSNVDRLPTENLKRAILNGRFDYANEVAELALSGAGLSVSGLNRSQQKAHDAAIATVGISGVCLIQGPPGTGKTKTISSIITTILNSLQTKILQCAPTNIAMASVAVRLSSDRRKELGDQYDPLECLIYGRREKLGEYLHTMADRALALDFRIEFVARAADTFARRLNDVLNMTAESLAIGKNKGKTISQNELAVKQVDAVYSIVKLFIQDIEALVGKAWNFELPTVTPFDFIHRFLNLVFTFRSTAGKKASSKSEELGTLLEAADKVVTAVADIISFDDTGSLNQSKRVVREFCLSLKEFFVKKARVFFSTLNGAYGPNLVDEISFSVVIVDEAAQAMEVDTTCVFRNSVQALILVGDTKQLEATVLSELCAAALFGRSLVDRLTSLKHPVYMLETQYRMHPRIAEFSSNQFYEGWLMNSSYVEKYSPVWYKEKEYKAVQFIAHRGSTHSKDNGGSSWNEVEAVLICQRVVTFLERYGRRLAIELKNHKMTSEHFSIGIICPYAAQKSLIEEMVQKRMPPEVHKLAQITVNTVDGFQGQERDIIILSLTRVDHVSGFLDDLRRVNVALTRAKLNLWVFGDERTYERSLGQFGSFGWFYSHCKEKRCIQFVDARMFAQNTASDDEEDEDDSENESVFEENVPRPDENVAVETLAESEQALLDAWSAAL